MSSTWIPASNNGLNVLLHVCMLSQHIHAQTVSFENLRKTCLELLPTTCKLFMSQVRRISYDFLICVWIYLKLFWMFLRFLCFPLCSGHSEKLQHESKCFPSSPRVPKCFHSCFPSHVLFKEKTFPNRHRDHRPFKKRCVPKSCRKCPKYVPKKCQKNT